MRLIYWDGKPGSIEGLEPDEYLTWDADNNRSLPGWYWLHRGTLDDPAGPFANKQEARDFRVYLI